MIASGQRCSIRGVRCIEVEMSDVSKHILFQYLCTNLLLQSGKQ